MVTIDFNKAYNPYCAYSTGYNCPIPPAENYLPIAVKAGEKNFCQNRRYIKNKTVILFTCNPKKNSGIIFRWYYYLRLL